VTQLCVPKCKSFYVKRQTGHVKGLLRHSVYSVRHAYVTVCRVLRGNYGGWVGAVCIVEKYLASGNFVL
jgi:hypothetical protein